MTIGNANGPGGLARRPTTVGGIGDIADRRRPTRRPIFEIDPDRTGPNDLGHRIDCGIGVSPMPAPVVAIASKQVATAPVARRFPNVKFPIRGASPERVGGLRQRGHGILSQSPETFSFKPWLNRLRSVGRERL